MPRKFRFKESDSIFHFKREPIIPTLETEVNLKPSDPCISKSRGKKKRSDRSARSSLEMKTAGGGGGRNKKAILIYQSRVSVRLNEQLFDFLLWRGKTPGSSCHRRRRFWINETSSGKFVISICSSRPGGRSAMRRIKNAFLLCFCAARGSAKGQRADTNLRSEFVKNQEL